MLAQVRRARSLGAKELHMVGPTDEKLESFFKAVGDPTRLKILSLLRKKEMCVSEVCDQFDMAQPTISHHLSILKNAGIVTARKEGKSVYYSLNPCCIDSCCGGFMKRLCC